MKSEELKSWALYSYRDEALSSGNPGGPLARGIFTEALDKMLQAADLIGGLQTKITAMECQVEVYKTSEVRNLAIIDRLLSIK